jgi:hypothetical protein
MKTASCFSLLFFSILFTPRLAAAEASTTYTLASGRTAGQIDELGTVLEITGERLLKKAEPADGKPKTMGVSIVCRRDCSERTLELPGGDVPRSRSVRRYSQASATVKLGDEVKTLALRPDRRLIALEIASSRVTPFCPAGPLTDDELELVSAVGLSSLPVDGLLPRAAVAVGEKWKAPDDVLASLLDLEEVTANSVEIKLKEVTSALARLELAGDVEGKRYGASNHIQFKAKCRFDRTQRRIDWLAMRVVQRRETSVVEGGMDVTLLLQMKITPKQSDDSLTDAALKGLALRPTDSLCRVLSRPDAAGWEVLHDRNWFLVEHRRDFDAFHRVVQGQDLAICKISSLPKGDPAKPVSLAQFRDDVQQALGKNFGEALEAAEYPAGDCRVLHLVVRGTDGELPVRWHYYHICDEKGRRATLAFRLEEKQAEAFGKAAGELVNGFRFQ